MKVVTIDSDSHYSYTIESTVPYDISKIPSRQLLLLNNKPHLRHPVSNGPLVFPDYLQVLHLNIGDQSDCPQLAHLPLIYLYIRSFAHPFKLCKLPTTLQTLVLQGAFSNLEEAISPLPQLITLEVEESEVEVPAIVNFPPSITHLKINGHLVSNKPILPPNLVSFEVTKSWSPQLQCSSIFSDITFSYPPTITTLALHVKSQPKIGAYPPNLRKLHIKTTKFTEKLSGIPLSLRELSLETLERKFVNGPHPEFDPSQKPLRNLVSAQIKKPRGGGGGG